jgi:hypothetical protein
MVALGLLDIAALPQPFKTSMSSAFALLFFFAADVPSGNSACIWMFLSLPGRFPVL